MRLISKLFVFTLVVGMLSSCVSKKKFDELTASKAATDAALAETQSKVKMLSEEKDALSADLEVNKTALEGIRTDLDATKAQMAQLAEKLGMTEAELAKVKGQIDGVFATYNESGLTLEAKNGDLYVTTSSPVNYRSSSSRLNKDQRNAVDALAETLVANPKVKILVTGHTDDKKFVSSSNMNNGQLSVNRAQAVVNRLIKKGVSPSQLTVAGAANGQSIGDDSSEGRAMDRRSTIQPNVDLGTLKN